MEEYLNNQLMTDIFGVIGISIGFLMISYTLKKIDEPIKRNPKRED